MMKVKSIWISILFFVILVPGCAQENEKAEQYEIKAIAESLIKKLPYNVTIAYLGCEKNEYKDDIVGDKLLSRLDKKVTIVARESFDWVRYGALLGRLIKQGRSIEIIDLDEMYVTYPELRTANAFLFYTILERSEKTHVAVKVVFKDGRMFTETAEWYNGLPGGQNVAITLIIKNRGIFSKPKVYVDSGNGDKRVILEGGYNYDEAVLSSDKKRIAASNMAGITLINIDRSNRREVQLRWYGNQIYSDAAKNLHFRSSSVVQFYLDLGHSYDNVKLGSFPLSGSGVYEMTVDDYNTPIRLTKIR